jgi:uncharacterized membrane protein YkvA (DUF1232 family)
MRFSLSRLRAIIFEIPRQAKLAYCLLRDERVPAPPKLALLAALGVIVSPLDLPAWIPVVGELDMLALGILAVKVFVEACPEELVKEHRRALERGDSIFDRDFQAAFGAAQHQVVGAVARWRGRRRPHVVSEQEESA